MDNALTVGMVKRITCLAYDMNSALNRDFTELLYFSGKTASLASRIRMSADQIIHNHIWLPGLSNAKFMQSNDIRVLKAAGSLGFLLKTLYAALIFYELLLQHFNGHPTLHQFV